MYVCGRGHVCGREHVCVWERVRVWEGTCMCVGEGTCVGGNMYVCPTLTQLPGSSYVGIKPCVADPSVLTCTIMHYSYLPYLAMYNGRMCEYSSLSAWLIN